MKTVILAVTTICSTLSVTSQIREGRSNELSISGAYQNISRPGHGSSGSLLLSPRLGFFVGGGVEIEPEAVLLLGSGIDAVYLLNGNVSYNFPVGPNGVPFLLAGYGIANTVPAFSVPFGKTDYVVGVLNLGAGVKIFFKEDVAVRLEYRYQNFSGKGDTYGTGMYSYTPETDYRLHTVQFGFSVLI